MLPEQPLIKRYGAIPAYVAIMGHAAAGVAWLVNKLAQLGDGLKKGDIVLGGSFTRAIDISSGDVIYADYGPLDFIGVSFEWSIDAKA